MGVWVSYVVEENIYVVEAIYEYDLSLGSILVCSMVIRSAHNYAMRILGYLSRQIATLTYSGPLKTPAPAIFYFLLHPVV